MSFEDKYITEKNDNLERSHDSLWLKSLLVLFLCLISAFIGSKYQSWIPSANTSLTDKISDSTGNLVARDSTLAKLSTEIGELKGRILAIELTRDSLARAAGIGDVLSEISLDKLPLSLQNTYSLPIDLPESKNIPLDLNNLEHQLSDLNGLVSQEEDMSYFMGLSLSDQTGFHASLPTYAPVKYPALSSSFGWRRNPVSGRNTMHEGLDFAAPWGTPIKAASGGIVSYAGPLGAYGNMVEIDHGNGLVSRYAHTSKILVKNGDLVSQGQEIAKVGSTGRSTGAHLHFEIRVADYPLDPSLFIDKNNANNQIIAKNEPSISANKS